ncbi:D-alanine--D-alanyl carrier protein ligase [Streptomyces tendae]
MTPDRSPAAGAPSATPAPTPAPTPATGPAADASVPWPPALLPTDAPRRPGAVPWASAVLDAPLPAGADPELSAAALAALLYRCTGQERMALAGPDGELRFRITDGATLRDLAANATRAAATGATTVAFAAGPDPAPHGAPFELVVSVQGDTVRLRHDPELFERGTAARLLAHYGTLLADALAHPARPVSRLRLLTDAELRTTLVEWNDTATDLPAQGCLHEAFEARADAAPDAVAVVQGADRLTYGEVNAAANRLAHHLRSLGVGPDDRVGLCLDRSAQLLVAELAVLKAGGAYVPLDPDYPASRIATMVTGTSCAVMVSRTDLTGNLPRTDGTPLVLLDRDADLLRELPGHNPGRLAGPDHLCYIIHTSGSTGAPRRRGTGRRAHRGRGPPPRPSP